MMSNVGKRTLLMSLLLVAKGYAERDPFHPAIVACPPAHLAPLRWQLKGIVGLRGDYRALLTAPGRWALRRQGERLDERWRLGFIGSTEVALEDTTGCQPVIEKYLKGSLYETDSLPAVVDVPVPGQG